MIADILLRSVTGRCGTCGKGRLFKSYLKFGEACSACGQDFTVADTADGPAFFASFLAMILFAPFFFIVTLIDVGPILKVGLAAAVLVVLVLFCLGILPILKGLFLNLQLQHKAEEAKFESIGKHGN